MTDIERSPGAAPERGDLHNCNVDEVAARNEMCGFADLRTGRICPLPARHRGPCGFAPRAETTQPLGTQPLGTQPLEA